MPSALFMLYRRFCNNLQCPKEGFVFRRPAAACFALGAWLNRWCYRKGLFREKKIPEVVVSVGNIVAGGSGKTQVVLKILESIGQLRERSAILSRGYRGKASKKSHSLKVDLNNHTAVEVGDEPYLIGCRFPFVPVFIGKDRFKSAVLARRMRKSVLILDDGFQFRKLKKDFNILIVNGDDPFGGHQFIPRGRLRDFPDRLGEADLIVVNGSYDPILEEELNSRTGVPKVFVQPVIDECRIPGTSVSERVCIENALVGVFCGLGNNQGFVSTVKRAGGRVVNEYFLPDHARISLKELKFFSAQTRNRGGELLLCSEKDFVKIPHRWLLDESIMKIGVLRSKLQPVYNYEAFEILINRIKEKERGLLL
ncbi:MAG: tetraacyldisaccharide 4'-kinase [Victivallaceae bacterium]